MIFRGGRRAEARAKTGYLGAEDDPRFSSPRRLRSAIATIIDLTLILALTSAVIWQLVVHDVRSQPVMLGSYSLLLLLVFALYYLLPSRVGATLGQLICGLTLVRCRDAGRPRIRDIARATLRNSTGPLRIRGIHALAPHLVVVRRRDLLAYQADLAAHPDHDPAPQPANPPEYHGAEGDPRYPSPRDLRKAISSVIDFTLIMVITPAAGVALALLLGSDTKIAAAISFWTLMPLQLLALPTWTGATLGQHLCGLTQIRGIDGHRPTFRDALGAGDSLPIAIRKRGDLYVTFTGSVVVRRHDLPHASRYLRTDESSSEVRWQAVEPDRSFPHR